MFDIMVIDGVSHGLGGFGIDSGFDLEDIVIVGSFVLEVEIVL